MNWSKQAEHVKENFLNDLQKFLQIPSVWDASDAKPGAPFGENVAKALQFMLDLGKREGFTTKNIEGYAGHLEWGQGEEMVGILCHVDVVPEGDHWDVPPYSAKIKDGRIYARGSQDDKGPTMAAFYALKILKDMGIPFEKRVRIILGADEECEWRCVDRYFQTEEMPTVGFAPDASFPMIYAEKGISDTIFTGKSTSNDILISFEGGQRLNMVPDDACCVLKLSDSSLDEETFQSACKSYEVKGSFVRDGDIVKLSVKGISSHGSEPQRGKNAVTALASILAPIVKDIGLDFLKALHKDFYGEKNGFAMSDEIAGPLTLNVGKAVMAGGNWEIGCNIRYPVTQEFEAVKGKMEQLAKPNFKVSSMSNKAPLYIPEDHPLVQTLWKVYEEQTGRKDPLQTTGGGTYARALNVGVAFGALFPDEEELYHQRNESASIDGLVRAIAIYTHAIYELACKKVV